LTPNDSGNLSNSSHPAGASFVRAIQTGDVESVRRHLGQFPELAVSTGLDSPGSTRTALHIVTDWPGYFPNGPEIVRLLIVAGANPNAPATGGKFAETPLHWAASSDDADVAVALVDSGADIEALGGSIADGTPLDNAIGYGCWHVARLLVERGARVDKLWHAAALGMMPRVKELLEGDPAPTPSDINAAFWQACHGGQRRVAEYLLTRGADIYAIPDYTRQTAVEAAGGLDTRRDTMVAWLKSLS
jgi:ankyrin repeat protein